MSKFRYDEDKYLKELFKYIEGTYGEHYSKNKFQATEFIIDSGHGDGFCIGNILKSARLYPAFLPYRCAYFKMFPIQNPSP